MVDRDDKPPEVLKHLLQFDCHVAARELAQFLVGYALACNRIMVPNALTYWRTALYVARNLQFVVDKSSKLYAESIVLETCALGAYSPKSARAALGTRRNQWRKDRRFKPQRG